MYARTYRTSPWHHRHTTSLTDNMAAQVCGGMVDQASTRPGSVLTHAPNPCAPRSSQELLPPPWAPPRGCMAQR